MQLRADAKQGGYTVESGWSLGARAVVPPVEDVPKAVDDRVQGDAEVYPPRPSPWPSTASTRATRRRPCATRKWRGA